MNNKIILQVEGRLGIDWTIADVQRTIRQFSSINWDKSIKLDGDFTADELEALSIALRKHNENR